MAEGVISDEENFKYLVKLLIKLKDMELARQHERERSEFSEKHRQKAGYYYGHQELEHPR